MAPKTVIIDLAAPVTLGSAVVYTGSAEDVYTGSDRISDFSLQYQATDSSWKDIPGATEKNQICAGVFGRVIYRVCP